MSTLKSILSKKTDNQLMFYINNPEKPVWVPLAIALGLFGLGTLLLMWLLSGAMR